MDVNDLPTCIRYGQGPRHMLDTFDDTFAALRAEAAPLMLDVTAHTHVMGRPSGAWVYDEIMARVKAGRRRVDLHARADGAPRARLDLTEAPAGPPQSGPP
jgi:hypothetical protein